MIYATTNDVEAELGRTASSSTETTQWQAWLDRVERSIIRRFVRSGLVLADEIAAGNVSQADVEDIEVAAVVRKIANPTGLTSVTRQLDDGSVTTRREGVDDTDPLVITSAEWAALLPAAMSGAFSTRPGFDPDDAAPDLLWT